MKRASGPCTAITARVDVVSTPPIAATTRSVFDAFGITSKTLSSSHHTMMSSRTEASDLSSKCVYCAFPGAILFKSFVSTDCNFSSEPIPSTRTVPRCDTSNIAAEVRQAACSANVPVPYASGISHPPNGTILAPSARWTASNGEKRIIKRRLKRRLFHLRLDEV